MLRPWLVVPSKAHTRLAPHTPARPTPSTGGRLLWHLLRLRGRHRAGHLLGAALVQGRHLTCIRLVHLRCAPGRRGGQLAPALFCLPGSGPTRQARRTVNQCIAIRPAVPSSLGCPFPCLRSACSPTSPSIACRLRAGGLHPHLLCVHLPHRADALDRGGRGHPHLRHIHHAQPAQVSGTCRPPCLPAHYVVRDGVARAQNAWQGQCAADPTARPLLISPATCICMHPRPIHESAGAKAVPLYLTMIGLHLGLGLALKICELGEGSANGRSSACRRVDGRFTACGDWFCSAMHAYPALTLPQPLPAQPPCCRLLQVRRFAG